MRREDSSYYKLDENKVTKFFSHLRCVVVVDAAAVAVTAADEASRGANETRAVRVGNRCTSCEMRAAIIKAIAVPYSGNRY